MKNHLRKRDIGGSLLQVAAILVLLSPTHLHSEQSQNLFSLEVIPQIHGDVQVHADGRYTYVLPNPSTILTQIMGAKEPELAIDLGRLKSASIKLKEVDLFSEDFVIREISQYGDEEWIDPGIKTFEGILNQDEDSHVRISISQDHISGFIGDRAGDITFIESHEVNSDGELLIKVYSGMEKAEGYPHQHLDYAISPYLDAGQHHENHNILVSDTVIYTAEIALVADYESFVKAGTVSRLATELISILNMTDGYYEDLGIHYELVEICIFTDQNAGGLPHTTNAGEYLRAFDQWVSDGGVSRWHDIATLWTGREIGYSYAWLGTIGQYGRHHLVEFWGLGETRWLANFQAHESGHNWGAGHVAHDRRYIMSPYIYSGPLAWNDTTLTNFNSFLQQSLDHLTTGVTSTEAVFTISQPEIIVDDNNNGRADVGEVVTLRTVVTNVGEQASSNDYIRLEINNFAEEDLEVAVDTVALPVLMPLDSVFITHEISIGEEVSLQSHVNLKYLIGDSEPSAIHHFELGIGLMPEYGIQLSGIELSGNADGRFHPGERVALVLNLNNSGELEGENIELSVTLDSSSHTYVDNLNSTRMISHLAAHGSREIRIPLDVSDDYPSGHTMDISIQMDDGEITKTYEKSFVIGLPEGYVYLEDFEYDRIGGSNSGWLIHSSGSIEDAISLNTMDVYDKMSDQWTSQTARGDRALSLEAHWVGSLRLVSPLITIDGFRRPELSFMEQRGWDHTRSGGTPRHTVQLQYAEDVAGPWITLSSMVTDETEMGQWKTVQGIDLELLKNKDVYLGFNTNQQHYYWRLDEITIKDAASDDPEIPGNYRVYTYPNPFNAIATILYDLDARADVLLEVFNIRGQRVSVLREGSLPAGTYTAHFNASEHASGIYVCRLLIDNERYITKMTLMK